MMSLILAAALGTILPTTVFTSADHWSTTGPPGGNGSLAVVVDRASGTAFAFLTNSSDLYRSDDTGRSWTPLASQPSYATIGGLAVDPLKGSHLLAANSNGVALSIDSGVSWNQVLSNDSIFQVSFDPRKTQAAYAVSTSHFYRSLDGGSSWQPSQENLPVVDGDFIASLGVAQDGSLFIALSATLWKSTDEGVTWSSRKYPADAESVSSLVCDPVSPNVLYAVTRMGLLRSTDGAGSWSTVGGGFASCLAIDPSNPTTLFAGASSSPYPPENGSVWRSTEDGAASTWKKLNVPLPPYASVWSLAIGPASTTIWAGTYGSGLFQSLDGGETWNAVSGLPGPDVSALTVDPSAPERVYAATTTADAWGIYRRDSSGGGWSSIYSQPSAHGLGAYATYTIVAIAVDPASSLTVFAAEEFCVPHGCSGDVLKTTDGGQSWAYLGLNSLVTALTIDPANSQILYASSYDSSPIGSSATVFKSTDGGATWVSLPTFPTAYSVNQVFVDATPPSAVFAVSCGGVFVSTDGGATWDASNQGLPDNCVSSIARAPGNPETLYVGTGSGIFKSADRATTWTPTGLSEASTSVVVDPSNSAVIYAGTTLSGVFRSLDAGASWTSINDGLGYLIHFSFYSKLYVGQLAIDPSGRFLHAATLTGVYDLQLERTHVIPFR